MSNSYEILSLADYQRIMPQFERCNDGLVLPNMHLVLRADAHRYGKWPNEVSDEYPFHDQVVDGLIAAAAETITQSGVKLNWCLVQGDEICYFFDASETNNPRRRQELITLVSSITSLAFSGSAGLQAAFHSVLSELPTNRHVLDFCVWQRLCWRRNAVSFLLGQLGDDLQASMSGYSFEEKLSFIQDKGIDWEQLPGWMKYGSAVWIDGQEVSALKVLPNDDQEFISFCSSHLGDELKLAKNHSAKPRKKQNSKTQAGPRRGPFRLGAN